MVLLCYDHLCSESPSFPSSYTVLDNSDWVVGYLHSLPSDLFSLSFSLTNFYVNSIEKQFQLGKSVRDGQSIRQCVFAFSTKAPIRPVKFVRSACFATQCSKTKTNNMSSYKSSDTFFFLMNTVTKKNK